MADPKIPLADLPYGLPGAFDRVAGVDTATGDAKQFPMPIAGEPKDYPTRASLPSASGLPDGAAAHVNNDPNPDNNGRWAVFGGQWVQSADRVTGLEGRVSGVESIAASAKALGETGSYAEAFASNSPITATNLTDAVTPVQTYIYGPGGLTINLTTGSRIIQYSTKNAVGGNRAKVVLTQTVNSGASAFVGFSIGAKSYTYSSNGRIAEIGTGDLVTTAPTFGPGAVITTTIDLDAAGNMTATWSHAGGSASITRTGVTMGAFGLVMRGPASVTHSASFESIGALQAERIAAAARPELTTADGLNIRALNGLLAVLARSVPAGVSVPVPSSVQVFKTAGARTFFTNVDLRPPLTEGDTGVTTVYVDPVSGLDTNAGTAASPFKSLSKAVLTPGQQVIVKARPGLYDKDTGWNSAISPATIFQVVPWGVGDIIASCHYPALVWTAVSGGVYSASATSIGTVFDASILTEDGDYSPLTPVASQALVAATPGSYFISGGTIYLQTADSRVPDSNVRVYWNNGTLPNGFVATGDSTTYLENVKFHGGASSLRLRLAVNTTSGTVLAKRCDFKYSSADGLDVNGNWLTILQGCVAAQNTADGFNYHLIFDSPAPVTVEIECVGRWNGRDSSGTNNGSTMHEVGSLAIRVGGKYFKNEARNVHDIGGSQSWNLGCVSRDSRDGYANWAAGLSSETTLTKMWLDSCDSSGGPLDLEALSGTAVIYTFDLQSGGNNVEGSDIQSYQP